MSVDFTPHAVYDIDTTANVLEDGQAGGASRFREALRQTFERLDRFPESAALFDPPAARYPSLRVTRVSKRYQYYAVYYQPTADGILVVRVLHNSRDIVAIFDPDPDPPTPPGS